MKKILVILLSLIMVMPLVACGSGSIAGKYTLVEMSMGEIKFDEAAIKEDGMSQELEFKEDGTGISLEEGGEANPFTWKDGKIIVDGEEMAFELKGDTLTIKLSAGEEEGMMTMVFKRK